MMIKPIYQDNKTILYLGDCGLIMPQLPNDCIDLIITDPPYTRNEYIPGYTILARESYRVMKTNSSLTILVGHWAVSEVCQILKDSGLRFNWIIAMIQEGVHARLPLGIIATWMPILWYVKSTKPIPSIMEDSFKVTGSLGIDKPNHHWQKDISWSDWIIHNFTRSKDIILDPFVGSGTSIISARKLGRYSIGIDIDESCIETTINRITKE